MNRSLRKHVLALTALVLLGTAAAAWSQLVPVGGEVQASSITSGSQRSPAVAMAPGGNIVVVWEDAPTFFATEIAGRLFDAAGQPLGSEFQLNVFANGGQAIPEVAMAADGSFVAVWSSFGQFPPANVSVVGRRFDATGSPLGPEFEISEGQTGAFADLAMAADGSFFVFWPGRPAGAGGFSGLYGRLYDAGGTPQTGLVEIVPRSEVFFTTALTATPDGGWLVSWHRGESIFSRRLDPLGTPIGFETVLGITDGDLALAAGGDRIVAGWMPPGLSPGGPPVQLFDGSFTPVTGLLQTSTAPALPTQEVALGVDATGSFVVAWTEEDLFDNSGNVLFPTRDGSDASIVARAFNAWGSPAGNDFLVNTTAEGYQAAPTLAMNAAGRFVVAWVGPDPATFQNNVFFQIFAPNAVPVAQCQSPSLPAGPSCSVNASVDAGSFDPDVADTLLIEQTPPGPYGLGVTNVTLTVTDDHGAADSCTATVTVTDGTAPTLACPPDFTTDAAVGDGGAFVPFALSSADACDPSPNVQATPSSGSFFGFGSTVVSVTSTDSSGNVSACTFTVTVLTPTEQIDAVSDEIDALVAGGVLTQNKANALVSKLDRAAAKVDAGQLGPACNQLGALINQINAYVGNGTLPPAEGQSLIDSVETIRTNLGC